MSIAIPIIQQQTMAGTVARPRTMVASVDASDIGKAEQQLGQGFEKLGDALVNREVADEHILAKKKQEDAIAWAGPAMSDFQVGWTKAFSERQLAAKPGTPEFANFTADTLSEFDKGAKELIANAPTAQAKKLVAASSTAFRTHLGQQAVVWETQQILIHRTNSMEKTIAGNAVLAAANPAMGAELYGKTEAMIDAAGVDQGTAIKLKENLRHTMANGLAASLATTNPQALYTTLERGTFPGGGNSKMLQGGAPVAPGAAASASVADLQAKPGEYNPAEFGKRPDGTPKGMGFLGVLKRPDGGVMTEYTIGVDIGGKQLDIPTLVPTLSRAQVQTLLKLKDSEKIPDAIADKAVAFAKARLAAGKSVFAEPGEEGGAVAPASSPSVPGAVMPSGARGIRNNNPGNIQQSDIPWQGKTQGADPRFETFATPELGIRALASNLIAYQEKHGYNTVGSIIGRWAPAAENGAASTNGYIANVSKALGVKPDEAINVKDPATLKKLTNAIIVQENGGNPYKDEQVTGGVESALSGSKIGAPAVAVKASAPAAAVGVAKAEDGVGQPSPGSTGNPILDKLTIPERLHWMQYATTQARQGLAAEQASFRQTLQDKMAAAKDGKADPAPLGFEQFAKNLGPMAPTAWREYREAQDYGQKVASMKTLPDAGISQLLTSLKPGAEGTEGYANQLQNFNHAQAAASQVIEARNKDGAAWAMQNAPAVQQAFQAMNSLPPTANDAQRAAATRAYVESSLSAQRTMSIRDPKILPKGEDDRYAMEFTQQKGGPDGLVKFVNAQSARWGAYWPQVVQEIGKKVPPDILVLASGLPASAAQLVAQTSTLKLETIQEGMAKDVTDQIKKKTQEVFEPLRISLATTDPRSGANTNAAFYNSAEKAVSVLVAQGMPASKAAERVFEDFIGSKYNFADTWRAPKQFNVDRISASARNLKEHIDEKTLDMPADAPKENLEINRNLYRNSIRDYGYWATSADERGLVLKLNGSTVTAGGKPVFYPFEDLASAGRSFLDNYGLVPHIPGSVAGGAGAPARATTPTNITPGGAAIVFPKAGVGVRQ